MKLKQRVYALFQFITFIALIFFLCVGITIYKEDTAQQMQALKWTEPDMTAIMNSSIVDVLAFRNSSTSMLFAGFLAYAGMTLIVFTWFLGFTIIKVKDRNLFDSMFLLFVIFPGISNIFALFAQLSMHSQTYTSSHLEKEMINQEKTRIINIFEERAKNIKKAHKEEYNFIETSGNKIPSEESVTGPLVMQTIGEVKSDMPTTKKAVAKKAVAAKPAAAKKATVAKPAAKKTVAAKPVAAKKAAVAKLVAKAAAKPAAKKTVAAKPVAAKKATVAKPAAKKVTAAKPAVAKKAVAAKPAVAKKATVAKKPVAKKATAKKAK